VCTPTTKKVALSVEEGGVTSKIALGSNNLIQERKKPTTPPKAGEKSRESPKPIIGRRKKGKTDPVGKNDRPDARKTPPF